MIHDLIRQLHRYNGDTSSAPNNALNASLQLKMHDEGETNCYPVCNICRPLRVYLCSPLQAPFCSIITAHKDRLYFKYDPFIRPCAIISLVLCVNPGQEGVEP